MNAEILLVILACVTAIALVLQSLSMWQAARSVNELAQRLDHQSRELEQNARQVMDRIQEVADSLSPLGAMADHLKTNMDQISDIAIQRVQDLDLFVQEVTELGRQQASKVDYLMSDTAQKLEQTTEIIQEDVLKPVVEISSFLKGISAGISYIFGRKSSSKANPAYPEEELFI